MHSQEKLYETLSLGIYHRFKAEDAQDRRKRKKANLEPKEENPFIFETFVANIIESTLGGKAKVTPRSGDRGVDIIHRLPNREILLGQVKCSDPENKIKYDPLAVLHSNIVTRNAEGAYFVTTSDYTPHAKRFAEERGIKLINGYELAQYWMGDKESWLETSPGGIMDHLLNGLDWMNEKLISYLQRKEV